MDNPMLLPPTTSRADVRAATRRALLLSLAAASALLAGASRRARAQAGGGAPIIDAPSAAGLAGAGGVLVDIRTPDERRRSGGPEGAVAIPLQDGELRFRAAFAGEVLAAAGGDRARPVALIDADGRRAQYAARLLAAQGFTQALAVGEGVHGSNLGPGWVARGLPMRPCEADAC
jgi:rhodanese-related sulfurtransferase